VISLSDEGFDDITCCEDDITHFIHNLGFMHKTLGERAPNLTLTNEQVLDLYKVWLRGIVEEEKTVAAPVNPFQEIIKQMFSQASEEDAGMSSGHPFSFRLYDDEDEADEV
tara:strand:- start:1924 stop:2256 length:333 start_codon:yes stop_codon:yes gene_type:complete